MNIVVASANGYGNAGDDICAIVSRQLVEKALSGASITVTAPPFDEAVVSEADAILLGGGGIIYDANPANMENYLAYVDYAISQKKLAIGLGLGEQGIISKEGEARYKKAFNKMDLLTVRSQGDADRLQKFGTKTVQATQDLAFSFDYSKYARKARFRQLKARFWPFQQPKKKLGIVLSNQEHLVNDLKLAFSKQEKVNARNFKQALEANIADIAKHYDVTLITQSRDDLEMAKQYQEKFGLRVHSYNTTKDMDALLQIYADQDLIMTQRFHGIVFSFMLNIPVIVLGYHGQKQHKLLTDMGLDAQLIPYHKPELLDETIIHLRNGDSAQIDRQIILQPSHKAFLRSSANQNLDKLKEVLQSI